MAMISAETLEMTESEHRDRLAAAQRHLERADALCLRWNRAAAAAGICGSEYVDDPERVFEAVRSNRETIMNVLRREKAKTRTY